MTVTPTGYLSKSLDAVGAMLAQCTDVQAILGVVDAASAAARIIPGHYRGTVLPPVIHLLLPPGSLPQIAIDGAGFQQDVNVWLVWPVEKQVGDSERDVMYRAYNRVGNIIAQCRALIGTDPSYPARADIAHDGPCQTPDDDQGLKGCWEASLTFTIAWR